jgi:probable O-glycosylation ligase (exosortase A-associated)
MIYGGFLLFLVLEYVRPGSYIPALNLIRLNSVVPLGVIAGTFLTARGAPTRELVTEANTKLIVSFLALIVFSALTADVTLYVYNTFVTVFGYVLVYWVIARQIDDVRKIKGVFATLVLIHLALALLTPQMFTDPDARHYLASGTFLGDGNDYALSVNIAIPFCLFLMGDAPTKRHKLFYGSLLLILVLCVVATKSRGGTLALAAVGFYYWLKSNRKVLSSVLVVITVMLVLAYAPQSYFERMGTISSHQDGSSQGRLIAWKAGTQMALDHPLSGVGAGHFPVKFGAEYKPKDMQMPWLTAHSIYFLVLGELGLPGIAVLILFFSMNFAANRRLHRDLLKRGSSTAVRHAHLLASLSASLLAYAVAGAFLSAAYYPHMFILGGLLVSGRRAARLALQDTSAGPAMAPVPTYHPAMKGIIPVPRRA